MVGGSTCENYATVADVDDVLYAIKRGEIGSTAPGTFFYYSPVTAPSSTFTIEVTQVKDNAAVPFFAIHAPGPRVYDANCNRVKTATVVSVSAGQATIQVSGATIGQTFTVAVKYKTNSVAGATQPSPPTVHYDFVTKVNGAPVATDPNGVDLDQRSP